MPARDSEANANKFMLVFLRRLYAARVCRRFMQFTASWSGESSGIGEIGGTGESVGKVRFYCT